VANKARKIDEHKVLMPKSFSRLLLLFNPLMAIFPEIIKKNVHRQ
jgi:hypothetical protein